MRALVDKSDKLYGVVTMKPGSKYRRSTVGKGKNRNGTAVKVFYCTPQELIKYRIMGQMRAKEYAEANPYWRINYR
jgi:hypothetical protein